MASMIQMLKQIFSRPGTAPELVVRVISHDNGNRSTVELDGGARVLVDGQSVAVGDWARIRDRVIVGTADNCTHYEISV